MKTDFVFGIPFYKGHIDPTEFNKREIVDTIAKNYEIDKTRNIWDKHMLAGSDMHHAYADWDNEKFHKIDFTKLAPHYEQHGRNYRDWETDRKSVV